MSDNKHVAKAVVHEKEGTSIYWLLPVIALAIAGWLVYKSLVEGDIEIQVNFESAEGLVEGKTELKYQGMSIGVVDRYELDLEDKKGVMATIKVKREAKPLFTENTKIWLVKPEVKISGISGLETLLSGNYIQMHYEDGPLKTDFTALHQPPIIPKEGAGLEITLVSDRLGSVVRGAPVMHRRIAIGEVTDYQFEDDYNKVAIKVFVKPDFVDVIRPETRFWESSGLSVSGDLSGFKVRLDSFASLITGGISLDTPNYTREGVTVEDGHRYELYDNYDEAHTGISVYVRFKTAKHLKVNSTRVQYKGVTIGKVIDVNPASDLEGMIATVSMDPRVEPALNENMRFWIPKAVISLTEVSGIENVLGPGIIEVDIVREGEPKRHFVALEEPPSKDINDPGLHITLHSDTLKSIERGTEILYRNIPIGSVQGFKLAKDYQSVMINVFIEPEYQHLVRKKSRFWNAGGLEIRGGLQGFQVNAPSVKTILAGGIELYTPEDGLKLEAKNGDVFTLHKNYDDVRAEGVEISIAFSDGDGLNQGTQLRYLGIVAGEVTKVRLNKKMNGVIADVLLKPSAAALAKKGSQFWLVKPELSLVKTANLNTLVTGKFINVIPGKGDNVYNFKGLLEKPVTEKKDKGLNLVLITDRLGSIKEGVKILYRDVAVGEVTAYSLSDQANEVLIYINIQKEYAPLIHENTVFWNTSGIGFDFSLFGGAHLQTSSLESIIEGGIAFATPPESLMGGAAKQGYRYNLFSEPQDKWLQWAPKITLKK